jgi:repressor LexA
MEPMGAQIRRQRRRLGLTLDELAGRTGISKPYLSLIETGRVPNPPSDEKLRKLEQTLAFSPGDLIGQAHLQRTPMDVRVMLKKLIEGAERTKDLGLRTEENAGATSLPSATQSSAVNLDDAYLSGVLRDMLMKSGGRIEPTGGVAGSTVPVINRVAAGYPTDFTDLSYPPKVADDYVACPDVRDKDAFAARVHGDSMTPKYREGDIVIFSPALGLRSGDDCFVRFSDGQTTFKRIFFETADGGGPVVRLQPRNERYRAMVVASEQIAGVYKAVYKYQRVDEE